MIFYLSLARSLPRCLENRIKIRGRGSWIFFPERIILYFCLGMAVMFIDFFFSGMGSIKGKKRGKKEKERKKK